MSAAKTFALPPAVGWVLLACAWFYTRPFAAGLSRTDVLLTLDGVFFGEADPAVRTGLQYLPQRFPAWGIAAVLWVAACGWGTGVFALCRDGFRSRFSEVGLPARPGPAGSRSSGILAAERLAFAAGLGMATLWTLAFLLGSVGWLNRWTAWGLVGVGIGSTTFQVVRGWPAGTGTTWKVVLRSPLLATLPFLALLALAATLPATEFDAREYHLQAAKEFFLAGRVTHLPHNVYTNFPLGTETVLLLGMTLAGDWRGGALAGQAALAGFVPLAGLATFCVGRRLFGTTAGVWAAVVFLTSPWAVRFAAHPLAEGGLTAFLALTLLAGTIAVRRRRSASPTPAILLGLCAGAAFACKYPAAVQAVVPAGLAVAAGFVTGGRATGKNCAAFAAATLVFAGPWLVRNLLNTGNPVFPLLWSVLGGDGWDAAT